MGPHLQYLSAGIGCWKDYLNYISEQLSTLVGYPSDGSFYGVILVLKTSLTLNQNKGISMSRPFAEFKIEFSSIHWIHHLRQKIQYAQSILTNTLETVATIQAHEDTVSNHLVFSPSARDGFKAEINNISKDLRNFHTTAQRLLALSTDSRSIVRVTLS